MKKQTLEQRIIDYLTMNPPKNNSIDLWDLANALYDNCMNFPQAGNGIKIANLRRAAEKSEKLYYFIGAADEARTCLIKKP